MFQSTLNNAVKDATNLARQLGRTAFIYRVSDRFVTSATEMPKFELIKSVPCYETGRITVNAR